MATYDNIDMENRDEKPSQNVVETPLDNRGAQKPYRLGLALGGGGIRGLAHAGALKAIHEAGLKPDIVAGVSAGSVIAVLYAAGVDPDDMVRLFIGKKVSDFAELGFGKGGIMKIERFTACIMDAIGGYKNIEDLPMPVRIGCTNLDDAMPEYFDHGPIETIMRASCSIPIAIKPVPYNGKTYVDGGVLRNLPAWTIREECDQLIGINVSPVLKQEHSSSMLDIAMRTYHMLSKANQDQDMAMCDLSIVTNEISHYHTFDLKVATKVFHTGYVNARKALRDNGWWHQ